MRTRHRPWSTGAPVAVALRVAALGAVMLALAMTACSGDKKAPTTTAPPGFVVMSDAKAGLAVAVPSDWVRVALSNSPDQFNKTANALRLANPKLASILNKARLIGQSGGTFMAVTPDGIGDINLTVDKPKEKTVAEIVRNSMTGLQNLEATNFAQESSTLAGKPATKLTFRIPVDTDAGRTPIDVVQHYQLRNKKAYILSVSAVPADVSNAVAQSLRLS